MDETKHFKERPVPDWSCVLSGNGEGGGYAIYRDEKLKCQQEIETPKNQASGNWGKPCITFYLDGDSREFATEEEMIDALISRSRRFGVPGMRNRRV